MMDKVGSHPLRVSTLVLVGTAGTKLGDQLWAIEIISSHEKLMEVTGI